jgi:transcriptional regulator with XRE-family HTH domain
MELAERIRFMRMFKHWTQDDMAEKLGMAVSGYAKIERGETDIPFSRLQQIAKTFEMELSDLIGLNEKNVFNIVTGQEVRDHSLSNSTINVYSGETAKLQHENEKLQLIVEQKEQELYQKNHEIELLQQQVNDLRIMLNLLQKPRDQ